MIRALQRSALLTATYPGWEGGNARRPIVPAAPLSRIRTQTIKDEGYRRTFDRICPPAVTIGRFRVSSPLCPLPLIFWKVFGLTAFPRCSVCASLSQRLVFVARASCNRHGAPVPCGVCPRIASTLCGPTSPCANAGVRQLALWFQNLGLARAQQALKFAARSGARALKS